jgi:hypothetical protein
MGIKYKWFDNRHRNHVMAVIKKQTGPHYAEIRCCDCDKWIKWLSKSEYKILKGE